eukprot:2626149-Rhodomonas_salina.1
MENNPALPPNGLIQPDDRICVLITHTHCALWPTADTDTLGWSTPPLFSTRPFLPTQDPNFRVPSQTRLPIAARVCPLLPGIQ